MALLDNPNQIHFVREFMLSHGDWQTLDQIRDALASQLMDTVPVVTGVAASLRALRTAKYGSYFVDKRYLHDGIWEYRVRAQEEGARPEIGRSLFPTDGKRCLISSAGMHDAEMYESD